MKLRVAIIGCGSIAEFRHAPEYHANPQAEIAAFCDPAPGRAERLAQAYGGLAFTNYEDVLALDDVDAVSVCTSNATHAEVTVRALRASKHVLCEKPISTTLADARQMIRAAERHGKVLMVGHNQRLAPAHVMARELLAGGTLGRVLTFKTTFGHGGPETWSADKGAGTWFFRRNAASLGALGDLGVHKADLMRFLLGDEIDEVYAAAGAYHKTYENGDPIDVEDNAICVLKTRRGIAGTLCASWTYYGGEDNSTILYCEHGILAIYASKEHPLVLTGRDGTVRHYDAGAIQTNDSQTSSGVIDAFVASALHGTRPAVTGEDGYEALSIALACSQSAKEGRAVAVGHYRDSDPSVTRKRANTGIAMQNLQMETNLFPTVQPTNPSQWFCDENYPIYPARHRGREADLQWRQRVALEHGEKKAN